MGYQFKNYYFFLKKDQTITFHLNVCFCLVGGCVKNQTALFSHQHYTTLEATVHCCVKTDYVIHKQWTDLQEMGEYT